MKEGILTIDGIKDAIVPIAHEYGVRGLMFSALNL